MEKELVIRIEGVQLSHSCKCTLDYFQEQNNRQLKEDLNLLKDILVAIANPEPDVALNDETRKTFTEGLAVFIVMIADIRAIEKN